MEFYSYLCTLKNTRINNQNKLIMIRKRQLLSCVMLLAATCSQAQSGSATWMSGLPDNLFIAHMSLPGSHDSATGEGVTWATSYWAQVQGKSLDEQWQSGIRVFDIRVKDNNGSLNCYHGAVKCKIDFSSAMNKITGYVKTNPTEFAIVLLRDEDNNGGASPWTNDVANVLSQYDNLVSEFRTDLSLAEVRGKVLVLTRDDGGTSIPNATKINYRGNNDVSLQGEIGNGRLVVQDIYDQSGSGKQEQKTAAIKNLLYASASRAVSDMTWYINHSSGYTSGGLVNMTNVAENAARLNPIIISELERIGGVGMVLMDFAGSDSDYSCATNSQKLTDAIIAQNFKTRPFEIQISNGDLDTNTSTTLNGFSITSYDGWTLTSTGSPWIVNSYEQHCFNGRYAESTTTEGQTLGDRQMSQKMMLPPGTYSLSCNVLTTGTGAKYFIGTTEQDISNSSNTGMPLSPISFTLTETQEVEFGVRLSGYTGHTFAVDNFRLTTDKFEPYGSPTDLDITPWIVQNPSFDNNSGAAWTVVRSAAGATSSSKTSFDGGAVDSYENSITMLQTVNLPKGYYELQAKGFERAGLESPAYYSYKGATINSYLVAGDEQVALNNLFKGAPTSSEGFAGSFYTPETNLAVPRDVLAATSVMAAGYYDKTLPIAKKEDGSMELGLKIDHKLYGQWTVADDFKLIRKYTVTIDNAHTFTPVNTVVDIVLNRSFADDEWTLLVLPFDVANPSAVFGSVEIAKFESRDGNDLKFSTKQGQNIEANVPVLIRGKFGEKPYRFESVSIVEPENDLTVSIDDDRSIVGTYAASTSVPTSSYVLRDNQLTYVEDNYTKISPSHAYIKNLSQSKQQLKIVVDGSYLTAIDAINTNDNGAEAVVYDLFGRKMDSKSLRKGIYVVNGKKVINR